MVPGEPAPPIDARGAVDVTTHDLFARDTAVSISSAGRTPHFFRVTRRTALSSALAEARRARLSSSRRLFSGLAGARACLFPPRAALRLPRRARSRTCRRRTRRPSSRGGGARARPRGGGRGAQGARAGRVRVRSVCASRGASGGRRARRRARAWRRCRTRRSAPRSRPSWTTSTPRTSGDGDTIEARGGRGRRVSQPGDPVIERQVRRAVAGVKIHAAGSPGCAGRVARSADARSSSLVSRRSNLPVSSRSMVSKISSRHLRYFLIVGLANPCAICHLALA